jgi:hypothetical protein
MEAQPGGGRVIRLVAEGLDPISLPNLEFDSPDQLLGAVSSSVGLSNAQLALWDAVQGTYVAGWASRRACHPKYPRPFHLPPPYHSTQTLGYH